MDTKISYARFTRRILAEVLDFLMFSPHLICGVFICILLDDKDFFQEAEQLATKIPFVVYIATTTLVLTVFKILMVTKLGGTPGKLLCGMYIKDASTLKNVTLIQAAIRCISKGGLWIIFRFLLYSQHYDYAYLCLLIVLILVLFAIFDQRKQTVYDKIAKTVVIDYKPS
jgi:uncharacterized RDD family membrane protein YckC